MKCTSKKHDGLCGHGPGVKGSREEMLEQLGNVGGIPLGRLEQAFLDGLKKMRELKNIEASGL